MSSLRNSIQRRNHKERAQPLERSKWGLLEKHKDYALRARDHNEKRKRLKILREKAADRNPDEFHFGMMRSKTVDGKRVGDRGNKALSLETAKLLKTQDAGYLRTMLQVTRKEREMLEQALVVDNGEGSELRVLKDREGRRGKHTVFVETRNEQREFDPKKWFGTDDMGLQNTFNRPRKSDVDAQLENDVAGAVERRSKSKRELEAEHEAWKEQRKEQKKRLMNQKGKQNLLEAVKQRESALTAADRELELQRAKMSNSIGGVNKNGIKFKIRERKR